MIFEEFDAPEEPIEHNYWYTMGCAVMKQGVYAVYQHPDGPRLSKRRFDLVTDALKYRYRWVARYMRIFG